MSWIFTDNMGIYTCVGSIPLCGFLSDEGLRFWGLNSRIQFRCRALGQYADIFPPFPNSAFVIFLVRPTHILND
jgi:hypothetical protein